MSGSYGQIVMFLLIIIPFIIIIASIWVLYQKAGKQGWNVLIPIYGPIVLSEIIRKPWYWGLLMIIPYIGFVWKIWSLNLLVKSFGKSTGYRLGCIFLPFIFLPILAFDSNTKYIYGDNQDFGNSAAIDYGVS